MTTIKNISASIAVLALVLGAVAMSLPYTAHALNAPRCEFNAIVQPFNAGGTTLSWRVYDAYAVHITGIGNVSDSDSVVVYPNVATSYTLTATGNGGVDTCTLTVQPTSAYPVGYPTYTQETYKCQISAAPDFVVPGGTAVLSWDTGSANRTTITGLGVVGRTGTRAILNTGVPQTFVATAEWDNGVVRTCSTIVRPGSAGVSIPGAYIPSTQYPGVSLAQPAVNVAATVPINQVPYTGPNDLAYVLVLLTVAAGAFGTLYVKRDAIARTLKNFSV